MMRKSAFWLWIPNYFKTRNFNNKKRHVNAKNKNKRKENREHDVSKSASAYNHTLESFETDHHYCKRINNDSNAIINIDNNSVKRTEMDHRVNVQESVPLSVNKCKQDLGLLACKAQILLHALRAGKTRSQTTLGDIYSLHPCEHAERIKEIRQWEQKLFNSVQGLKLEEKLAFIALTAQREVLSQLMHVFAPENHEHSIALPQSKLEMSQDRFVVVPDEELEKLSNNNNLDSNSSNSGNSVVSFLHRESNQHKERLQKEQVSYVELTSLDEATLSAQKLERVDCIAEKNINLRDIVNDSSRSYTKAGKNNSEKYTERLHKDQIGTTECLFKLDELVIFLELYEKIECEDGKLLQFLLDEVNNFLYSFVAYTSTSTANPKHEQKSTVWVNSREKCKRVAWNDKFKYRAQSQAELVSTKIAKLPLPSLLLVLSELGIVQESTLQLLTFHGKRYGFHTESEESSAHVKNTSKEKNNIESYDDHSDHHALTNVKSQNGIGILFHQLALYDVNELIILLVALRNFKMHNEYIFAKVVNTIHSRLKKDKLLCEYKRIARLVINKLITVNVKGEWQQTFSHENNEVHKRQVETLMEENEDLCDITHLSRQLQRAYAKYGKHASVIAEILHQLPRVHSSDLLSLELLLDALKSLFFNEYSNKEVILFIGNLIAQHALEEIDNILTSSSTSASASTAVLPLEYEEQKSRSLNRYQQSELTKYGAKETDSGEQGNKAIVRIAKQVLGASRLCEEMQIENALLRITFMWCTTLTECGVVLDGGEDAEVTSENRAYYDHVTADLIKIRYVK